MPPSPPTFDRLAGALLLTAVAATATLYLHGAGAFWLGDDFANLHRAHADALAGTTGKTLVAMLVGSTSEGASFWRPGIVASFAADHALWGPDPRGAFAQNLVLHLAAGVLIAALARRHAPPGPAGDRAAAAAAGLFLLMPWGAEAVYWVSARSDLWVTFAGLLGLLALGRGGRTASLGLPGATLMGLAFKESAALLPAVAVLVLLATPAHAAPDRRGAVLGIVAAAALVLAYFVGKAMLFGDPLRSYGGARFDPLAALSGWLASIPAWARSGWDGATGAAFVAFAATLLLPTLALFDRDARRCAGVAWLAVGGTLLATSLQTGPWPLNGEGGRLLHTAQAWWALGAAAALALPSVRGGVAAAMAAVLAMASATLLTDRLGTVHLTQRLLADSAGWVARRPADAPPMLLVLPDHVGPVVALRNGQGGLVLPPIQRRDRLGDMLPSLPGDLEHRHGLLRGGFFATRHGPDAVPVMGCWSWTQDGIVMVPTLSPAAIDNAAQWATAVRRALAAADCAGITAAPTGTRR